MLYTATSLWGRGMWVKYLENTVNRIIMELDHNQWKGRCTFYTFLVNPSVDIYHMCAWWVDFFPCRVHAYCNHAFARQNRVIVICLLTISMYRETICQQWNLYGLLMCHIFNLNVICNKDIRKRYWNEVRMNSPARLFSETENMTVKVNTKFILNVCNVDYIREWNSMFDSLTQISCTW